VIHYLKEQEGVDGIRRLWTRCDKPNPPATVQFGEFITNLFLEPRHGGRARRVSVVNKHWRLEIPGSEHLGYMYQVSPNLIDARFVFQVVGRDFDLSSIAEQSEMMRGAFV
jgi:hypothetical protein